MHFRSFETLHVDYRIMRSITIDAAGQEYVEAAFARGESVGAILWRELLPNMWTPIIADAGIEGMGGYLRGYIIMLVALSMVFVGIKHYRDRNLGGFIKFGTAFLLGLVITTVASILYVIGWEIASSVSNFDFAKAWADSMVAGARARGAAPAEIESEIPYPLSSVVSDVERALEQTSFYDRVKRKLAEDPAWRE